MNSLSNARLRRSLRSNLRFGLIGVVIFFGSVGGWAATTDISGAVIATGQVSVEGHTKQVQSSASGVVRDLKVEEGQLVSFGDVLIQLDETSARAKLNAISNGLDQLLARQARLESERDGLVEVPMPPQLLERVSSSIAETKLSSERRLFNDRRLSRDGQRARLKEQEQQIREQIAGLDVQQRAKTREIDLIGLELQGQRRLLGQGLTSLNRVNSLDRSAARLEGERGQLIASIATAKARITEIELQLLQVEQTMRTEVATELRDVENKRTDLREQEISALNELQKVTIRSPATGIVHKLVAHTVGGVITAAEPLMEIVPRASDLILETKIAPRDIDQVVIGQLAMVRMAAFNRNTTPELEGTVSRISADLEADPRTGVGFYTAVVRVDAQERDKVPDLSFIPGMPVEVYIRTGQRTVLSYLVKPIGDHASKAFREE